MSPGANKRQTGTVPKAKTSRKNSVPQEMVAPTRRDLQQHLNVSQIIVFCLYLLKALNLYAMFSSIKCSFVFEGKNGF